MELIQEIKQMRQELEQIAPKSRCFKDCRASILVKAANELPARGWVKVTRCGNCELWAPTFEDAPEKGGFCRGTGFHQRPDFYCGDARPIVKHDESEASYRSYLESGTEDFMSYEDWLNENKRASAEPI